MNFDPGRVTELLTIFQQVNAEHFDSFLDPPILRWNSRLRTSAGRFIPGSRKFFRAYPPAIEVASYLMTEAAALALIQDTVAHEMIHYWLWVRKRPYGHSDEFYQKMELMGVSRYNPVPRNRTYRYAYRCQGCQKEYLARKKLGSLACATCCKKHAGGRFDSRFILVLDRKIEPGVPLKAASSELSAPASTPAPASAPRSSFPRLAP